MPIGADLVLKERPDHEAYLLDGERLGAVIVEAAHRFRTPLAFPLMDLTVEKADLVGLAGLAADPLTFHFEACPEESLVAKVAAAAGTAPPTPRMRANCAAIARVAREADLVPVGMAIGPFSLMTKLLADPITGVYLLAMGEGDDDEAVAVERALALSTAVVLRGIRLQVAAGARAVCVCEPAANKVYVSPIQLAADPGLFDRLVMENMRRVRKLLGELGADLIFHDCGELTETMVQAFNSCDPAVLSLGSSRQLWEDARLIKPDTVLFGNLPSKKFFSDTEITRDEVSRRARELLDKMRAAGHPFILGSECDVLAVPGSEQRIKDKVEAMLSA